MRYIWNQCSFGLIIAGSISQRLPLLSQEIFSLSSGQKDMRACSDYDYNYRCEGSYNVYKLDNNCTRL